VTLNLAQEEDRLYMNSFMSEVGSYLESVSTIEEKIENALKKSKINRVKKLLKAVVLVA
jgi:transcription termination factor NusB